jgi:hypothetical protein
MAIIERLVRSNAHNSIFYAAAKVRCFRCHTPYPILAGISFRRRSCHRHSNESIQQIIATVIVEDLLLVRLLTIQYLQLKLVLTPILPQLLVFACLLYFVL